MDENERRKLDPHAVYGRKPDEFRIYHSNLGKDWEEAIKPRKKIDPGNVEPDIEIGMSQSGTLDKYKPYKGILEKDVFFAGLENEIPRVNRKLGV